MNWYGLYTLFGKEVWRFMKVGTQTILAPVVTVLLYLLVFASVLEEHIEIYEGISYTTFLIPGLMMMSIIQNAFANSSSSLFQSKMTGSITFMLLPPLSSWEFYLAFIAAAVLRGLLVGLGVWIATLWFVVLPIYSFSALLVFSVLGSALLGTLGLIASLWADKWDHISAFQNFIILPLTFLSGVFYRIDTLPDFWQKTSYYNPFFYMIDGFRYGFLGVSEIDMSISLVIVSVFLVTVSASCLWLLHIGYKIRY
ncbi:MAG: metal-dependent hydrolase [Candidatus Parabeggiatoa sp. nov. 2]|nr:MAG: metal-dependent hydrolase [Beggiatoa sp. 4572_84]RKZ62712.1 MAG: metal-dependent hydrolase [Gammaproteobacteria bacterium]HEC84655.1 ABC transporter permease [Thioploca sp.]